VAPKAGILIACEIRPLDVGARPAPSRVGLAAARFEWTGLPAGVRPQQGACEPL